MALDYRLDAISQDQKTLDFQVMDAARVKSIMNGAV